MFPSRMTEPDVPASEDDYQTAATELFTILVK